MIKVIEKNGEQQLHQWDTGRQLRVLPPAGLEVDEIHFQGPEDEGARRREVREENGMLLVDIPDLFLQSYGFRKVWAVCNGQTVHTEVIKIKPKQRPNDYVDPEDEDEVRKYSDLLARIEDLEENQQPGQGGDTSEIEADVEELQREVGKLSEDKADKADIPTDEHINELINVALGVVENGYY